MIDSIKFSKLLPHANVSKYGGIIIKNSSVINTPLYLQELWNFIESSSSSQAKWIQESITSLESIITKYDLIIVACGSSSSQLWPSILPFIHLTRGYNLVYPDPGGITTTDLDINTIKPLQYSILSGNYIFPHPSKSNHLLCGSTKESVHVSNISEISQNNSRYNAKSIQEVKDELHDMLCEIYPPLQSLEPIETWSGIRTFISRKSNLGSTLVSLPVIDRHEKYPHVWLVTGFGSRGLIHHQLVAKYLLSAIENNSLDNIPPQLLLNHKL